MSAPSDIMVLGGGIAGIAVALALSQKLTPIVPDLKITIYELHDVPSTSGGAINLTPVAQRHLDQLGVLDELNRMGPEGGVIVDGIEYFSLRTAREMGSVDFAGKDKKGFGGYKGRRLMRITLMLAMLACVERTPNISVEYGKKVIGGLETNHGVTIFFADGTNVTGDIALGCDGVHSQTRTKFVDPSRPSHYTGISFVQSTVKADHIKSPIHFDATAMNQSRHGSVLTTYCDAKKDEIFIAALVEIDPDILTKLMWKREGSNWRPTMHSQKVLRQEMRRRFGDSAIPCVNEMVDYVSEWMLYPVYEVEPNGKWFTDRVLLIGDAAHAMPPRDESVGFAIDDAILFSRILAAYINHPISEAFKAYESVRRKPVNEGYKDAVEGWVRNKDTGRMAGKVDELLTPLSLMRRRMKARSGVWMFDAHKVRIPSPPPLPAADKPIKSWGQVEIDGGAVGGNGRNGSTLNELWVEEELWKPARRRSSFPS